jgi:DNA-binding NtrC family response regulator
MLPLQGLTLLAVEDSRFASEALRLICQRSGARLRRAESVATARAHLRVYRPDVVIIDMGLPDEPGQSLIAELASIQGFDGLILAISGDPDARQTALNAGAAAFIDKPIDGVFEFQQLILTHLSGPRMTPPPHQTGRLSPDSQALRDDLNRAAGLIKMPDQQGYVADFVRSLARSSHDVALEQMACAATHDGGMDRLARAIAQRLRSTPSAFEPAGAAARMI